MRGQFEIFWRISCRSVNNLMEISQKAREMICIVDEEHNVSRSMTMCQVPENCYSKYGAAVSSPY